MLCWHGSADAVPAQYGDVEECRIQDRSSRALRAYALPRPGGFGRADLRISLGQAPSRTGPCGGTRPLSPLYRILRFVFFAPRPLDSFGRCTVLCVPSILESLRAQAAPFCHCLRAQQGVVTE